MRDESIETKLDTIHAELKEVRGILDYLVAQGRDKEPRAGDLVDADYIAKRTGLSARSIKAGKAGINRIPIAVHRPRRWRKSDVDRWLRGEESPLMKRRATHLLRRKK